MSCPAWLVVVVIILFVSLFAEAFYGMMRK